MTRALKPAMSRALKLAIVQSHASPQARGRPYASPQARDCASPQARDCTTSREPSSSRTGLRSSACKHSNPRANPGSRCKAWRSQTSPAKEFQAASQSRLAIRSVAKSNRPRERVPSHEPVQARDAKDCKVARSLKTAKRSLKTAKFRAEALLPPVNDRLNLGDALAIPHHLNGST